MTYAEHLAAKFHYAAPAGFAAAADAPWLFPHQRHTVEWALAGGRRAVFLDTGLGKTRIELAWADHVCRHTGGRVLLLAPLAVGAQTVREAGVVGLEGVVFARTLAEAGDARIVVSNYDSLDHWDGVEFAGVVLDESSILKSFMGKMRTGLIARFRNTPYRLACTATPAPNDFDELGNHSEFLGLYDRVSMLSRFFVNDLADTGTWRVKNHAVVPFWDWVASWAIVGSLPSHVGPYDDRGYILPPLTLHRHVVDVDIVAGAGDGFLFRMPGLSATGIHGEKRRTADVRAAKVAALIAAEPDEPWLVWVETNYEAEAVMALLPGAVEVEGSMKPEIKTARLLGFCDGGILVTKAKIAGFGMNWQHCARVVFAGGSYSYESFYQSIRRCWRFGQRREVDAHVVMAYTEQHLWDVVSAKSDAHGVMRDHMIAASVRCQAKAAMRAKYVPTHDAPIPAWFTSYTSGE
jgi:hypothetical protein